LKLLEGKNIRLRVREKEDLPMLMEWMNNPEFVGEYQPSPQRSRAEMEKMFEGGPFEPKVFIIEKKDGTKIGYIGYGPTTTCFEIGYGLIPSERSKGYCAEAIKIVVDYMFLSKEIVRIQAQTDVRNIASQKVLEKVGFKKEGIVRKLVFIRGEWRDYYLYSIIREEWKEPKILTKTA
jgi:ribosomal-protein-alanine N-acetyltransferase